MSQPTLLLPQAGRRVPALDRGTAASLAPELLGQSVRRLRVLVLLYAFIFFMAGFFVALLFADDRARLFQEPANWVPGVVSIAVALLVWAFTLSRVPPSTVMTVGLVFQVVSSYGIACAEYLDAQRLNDNGWMGLSWVAVWTLLYTVVIPTRPRRALLATLASVSAVPVVIGFMVATDRTTFSPSPVQFFFGIIFPYLLTTTMAYVGARVVYALGTEVTEARELGSYRLVERLGAGGMGEVWRAQHQMLARPAAIKLIRGDGAGNIGASDEAVRRFEQEAQVTARLSSPHTVQLFDFGVAGDGRFYYVMELLDGLDLETLVKRHGPLPAERVIHLLRQVCHSLAEAASFGLVHRDIKPANLFVCRYGGDCDFVKVLDFGIAKAADHLMETRTIGLTAEHGLRGTPAYIAPEQVMGGSAVDGRADIYAVGCVAYFLLTGHLVFTGDTPMAVVVHHANTPPTPPSQRSEIPIPPALDRLVMACLAKNPAERPQSARELAQRLAEIEGLNPWTEEKAREWWDTHHPATAPAWSESEKR